MVFSSDTATENSGNLWDRWFGPVRTWLIRLADLLDRSPALCIALIVGCLVPLVLIEAHSALLINDEIYTVHIAQAPSIRAMLALAREIDLHPPLHYLAQRAALDTGLPRWLAARLPSLLAALLLSLCLFRWTAARIGNLFGVVAVGVLWLSPALEFAWNNRPYMMWLAWISLLLLTRDAASRDRRPKWAIPAVFLVTLAMVMTHLLGIACIGPFLAAETWRSKRRGHVDWAYVVALALPTLCGAGFFYQIHHLSQNSFPSMQLPSIAAVVQIYGLVVGNSAVVLSGCLIAAVVLFGRDTREVTALHKRDSQNTYSADDLVLLGTLLFLPLAVLAAAHLLHVQFWLRYGFASTPAWATLAAWLLARRLPLARVVAAIMVISCVGYMVSRMVTEDGPQGNAGTMAGGRMPIPLSSLDVTLPIVASSPLTFVEMSDRETPEIARRVVYLTDINAAMQFAHYTLFENEDKIARLLNLPSHAEPLQPFLQEHSRFYVVGSYSAPDTWLLRKLAANGMRLDYLGKFQSTYAGKFESMYGSDDLFLVTR